eukprot:TRINITY_DN3471_c0_g1_i1.p1 TRINITY_DN3471_c0_g1~~TRINITY_DN3471_c0_g1_i1.p1  ORF type:complete len:167 (+),score=42.56 TRINITY_DN3471_c0_g1_i1:30-530(+)
MRNVLVLVAIILGAVSAHNAAKNLRRASPFRNFNWTRTAEVLRDQGRIARKAINLIEAIQTISRDPFDEEFPGKKRRLGDPWPTFPRIPRPLFLSEKPSILKGGKYSRTSPTNPRPPKNLLGLQEVEESFVQNLPNLPTRLPLRLPKKLPTRLPPRLPKRLATNTL